MASEEALKDARRWLEHTYPDGLKEMLDEHFAEGMDYARELDKIDTKRLREALRDCQMHARQAPDILLANLIGGICKRALLDDTGEDTD